MFQRLRTVTTLLGRRICKMLLSGVQWFWDIVELEFGFLAKNRSDSVVRTSKDLLAASFQVSRFILSRVVGTCPPMSLDTLRALIEEGRACVTEDLCRRARVPAEPKESAFAGLAGNSGRKVSQHVAKWFKNGTKMIPKWFQNGSLEASK